MNKPERKEKALVEIITEGRACQAEGTASGRPWERHANRAPQELGGKGNEAGHEAGEVTGMWGGKVCWGLTAIETHTLLFALAKSLLIQLYCHVASTVSYSEGSESPGFENVPP